MRKDITISAAVRDSRGKNEARRLRVTGMVPAIVYGAGQKAIALSVDPKQVLKILHSKTGHNTIFNLTTGDGPAPVMIVDWQFEPVKGNLLHVDLKRIDLSKRLQVSVPVHTQGEPKGVKQQGGLLEIVNREIEIECLPDDIPEHFTVDVTELLIGQNIRAADVQIGESIQLLSHGDAVIAHVVMLRHQEEEKAAEEAPAAEGAAPAEPEVIKKGKKEEGEE
jgi:large subunit ribosomal protein L25